MNLISCGNCGIVLNNDKLQEPEMHDEDGSLNGDWINCEFQPAIPCPVCKNDVFLKEKYND